MIPDFLLRNVGHDLCTGEVAVIRVQSNDFITVAAIAPTQTRQNCEDQAF